MSGKKLKFVHYLFDPGLLTPKIQTKIDKRFVGNWSCSDDGDDSFMTRTAPSIQYRYFHQILDERYAEYGTSCRFDDLTTSARKHAFENGKTVREYLVDNLKYLPKKMNPTLLRFFSAPDDSSMNAAKQFIDGLYPPLSDNEVLLLETSSEQNSSLVMGPHLCKDFYYLGKQYRERPEYAQFYEDAKKIVGDALGNVGISTDAAGIYDGCKWALSMMCNEDSNLPSDFTGSVMDKCKEVLKFETVGLFTHNETLKGVAVAPLMNHIFKYSDKGIGGRKENKVSIEAARYDVIASLAAFLGRKEIIPIGSLISVEIWEDDNLEPLPPQQIIRFILNGNEILKEQKIDDFRFETLPIINGFCPYQNDYNH
jgi:acid phosphatase